MEKLKKFFTSVPGIVLVFVLAALPLIYGGVGSARAALTYKSENYVSQVQMKDIGVSIIENGFPRLSSRDYANTTIETADGTWNEHTGVLLNSMLGTDEEGKPEKIVFNQKYKEELSVSNSGTIPQYVRVTVYKYWIDEATGKKTNVLSPSLIDLGLTNLNSNWILDEESTTPERIVLYYKNILQSGETAPVFSTDLTIKGDLKGNVRTYDDNGEKVTTYKFDNYRFVIEVTADAVQTHNPEPAMLSAWGRNVTISGETITSVK